MNKILFKSNSGKLGGHRLSETGQKSDSMFPATIIRTVLLLFFKLFYLLYFGQNSFSILMLLKTGVGVYM